MTYIGRLAREKNLTLLLDAWQMLAAERGGAQLVLVGRGPLQEEIRAATCRACTCRVRCSGASWPRRTRRPTSSSSRRQPRRQLAARSDGIGCPSVAVAAGGLQEFARHNGNAWLVAPGSVDALADGLRRLLHDVELRRRLAAGALETAAGRTWDDVYDRLIADYQAAIDGKRVTRAA